MKTQTRSLITLFCTAAASLLILGSPAQATPYVVTLQQVGANVVATGTGALDLTGLTLIGGHGSVNDAGIIVPFASDITVGFGLGDIYGGPISGPSSFGSGNGAKANSNTGDLVAMVFNGGLSSEIWVPVNYVSSGSLSDTSTYNNATFASLGVTPGTYEWTWGTGVNQNFTLQIGAAAVPDSGSTLGLLSLALVALLGIGRLRSLRLPN